MIKKIMVITAMVSAANSFAVDRRVLSPEQYMIPDHSYQTAQKILKEKNKQNARVELNKGWQYLNQGVMGKHSSVIQSAKGLLETAFDIGEWSRQRKKPAIALATACFSANSMPLRDNATLAEKDYRAKLYGVCKELVRSYFGKLEISEENLNFDVGGAELIGFDTETNELLVGYDGNLFFSKIDLKRLYPKVKSIQYIGRYTFSKKLWNKAVELYGEQIASIAVTYDDKAKYDLLIITIEGDRKTLKYTASDFKRLKGELKYVMVE